MAVKKGSWDKHKLFSGQQTRMPNSDLLKRLQDAIAREKAGLAACTAQYLELDKKVLAFQLGDCDALSVEELLMWRHLAIQEFRQRRLLRGLLD